MSQINPFRGVVVPPARAPRVQPQKDPPKRGGGNGGRQQEAKEEEPRREGPEDGKPHIDVTA